MEASSSQRGKDQERHPEFISNHAMVVRLQGTFSDRELQAALDAVAARHPALIPGRREDGSGDRFPLQVLPAAGASDWEGAVEAELLRAFPAGQGPFARFILLRQADCADLVAVFHHGVCDGMSGVYFLRDLLARLADPDPALAPLPPPPPTFALIPEAVRNDPAVRWRVRGSLAGLQLAMLAQRLRKRIFPASAARPASDPASRRFCLVSAELPPEQTRRLVARCKDEGTSVHAALCTAWLRVYAAQLEGRKTWVRSVSSPVSLRERLSVPETSGLYLTTLVTRLNCRPRRGFWQTAAELKRTLSRASRDENLFLLPLTISTAFSRFPPGQMRELMPLMFDRPIRYDFSVTNLGRLPIPAQLGKLHVQAFYNLVNTNEHERTVCVNTLDDHLRMTLLLRESNLPLERARELMQAVLEQLSAALSSS